MKDWQMLYIAFSFGFALSRLVYKIVDDKEKKVKPKPHWLSYIVLFVFVMIFWPGLLLIFLVGLFIKFNGNCPCGSGLDYENCCMHDKQGQ